MDRTQKALLGYGIDLGKSNFLINQGFNVSQLKAMSKTKLLELGLSQEQVNSLKSSTRKPIPSETVHRLLYKSRTSCCFCGNSNSPIIIHHIIPYSESQDNGEDNLVVLCLNHHAEAHTRREISQNLTPEAIRYAKSEWEKKVAAETSRNFIEIVTSKQLLTFSIWAYFNHEKIAQLVTRLGIDSRRSKYFNDLFSLGIIDEDGFITDHHTWLNHNFKGNYLYDTNVAVSRHLYLHYEFLLYEIVHVVPIIDITNDYSIPGIRRLIRDGDFYICQGAHYFRNDNENRKGYRKANGVETEFSYNPFEVTSDSALNTHLAGKSNVTVFGIVRSIQMLSKKITIKSTPLAIGTGFRTWQNDTGKWHQFTIENFEEEDSYEQFD